MSIVLLKKNRKTSAVSLLSAYALIYAPHSQFILFLVGCQIEVSPGSKKHLDHSKQEFYCNDKFSEVIMSSISLERPVYLLFDFIDRIHFTIFSLFIWQHFKNGNEA